MFQPDKLANPHLPDQEIPDIEESAVDVTANKADTSDLKMIPGIGAINSDDPNSGVQVPEVNTQGAEKPIVFAQKSRGMGGMSNTVGFYSLMGPNNLWELKKMPDKIERDLLNSKEISQIDVYGYPPIIIAVNIREDDLLKNAIRKFQESGRNSLATFSISGKKLGKIEDGFFKPTNYIPGQRSQDLEKVYHDAGQFYWGKKKAWLDKKNIFGKKSSIHLIFF